MTRAAQDQSKAIDKTVAGTSSYPESNNTVPGTLADFTRESINQDCARFKVTPGSEDLLLLPIDESSESLGASCGITNLPPGATISPVER